MAEVVLKYTQSWDYHYQHYVSIIVNEQYAASGYVNEDSGDVTITGVYVAEEFRGKGYGTKIFNELMKRVEEFGFNEVWLMVKKSNMQALKMYEKCNFKIEKDAGHGAYYWMKWNKEKE